MKKIFLCLIAYCCLLLQAQQRISQQQQFYYVHGEKIFLTERTDKIYLKLKKEINRENILSLIHSDSTVKMSIELREGDPSPDEMLLESKTNKTIPLSILEQYKSNSVIISAFPILQCEGSMLGLTDEFVVKLKESTSYEQFQNLLSQYTCSIVKENQFTKNQFLLSVPKTAAYNSLELSNLFYETGLFEFSEPNFVMLNAFQSNDTYFNQQWGLKNTGQNGGTTNIDIKVEDAWTITQGNGMNVAVIDQGVDLGHPDLINNLMEGYDPTGNGSKGGPVWQLDKHGTPCAGIIGAIKDNGIGVAGVAPSCRLRPIHVSTSTGGISLVAAADAIQWVWRNGADVISCSWGAGSNSTIISNAINEAVTKGRGGLGCVVVAATGNENSSTVAYPAALSNVIAVGAISPCGERKSPSSCDGETNWGSHYGTQLDVMAPGVLIPTTDIQGTNGYHNTSDYIQNFNGTSAACPHVSGVAALVLSANPHLTAQEVRDIIKSSAQKVRTDLYSYQNDYTNHPNGTWNNEMGYGLVNAYAAVQKAKSAQYTNNILDLWMKDTNTDTGEPGGYIWGWNFDKSPDIWVRNQADGYTYQVSQKPEYSSGNPVYVYVRVRNRGSRNLSVDENAMLALYWTKSSSSSS
jgi:subtilisin family serine protease